MAQCKGDMLKDFLVINRPVRGFWCLCLANRLYGITFKENKEIPVYHPDVKAYEVFDKDGSYLAVFYADFHPRKGKQGGAWDAPAGPVAMAPASGR